MNYYISYEYMQKRRGWEKTVIFSPASFFVQTLLRYHGNPGSLASRRNYKAQS